MSKRTHERLVKQLVKEINAHPHKDELVALVLAQLMDEQYTCTHCLLLVIDFYISMDEVSFNDIWQDDTCVSFHIGKYRVDLCCPQRMHSGTFKSRHKDGHVPSSKGGRGSQGS